MRPGPLARTLALAALAATTAACSLERPAFTGPSVPYLATPEDVGLEMLRMAGVTGADTVYDLGSGDGRLVIAAAQRFGARGVGVEIDARLVQDSREAALRAGVADRVTFLWQDLFQADIRPATAVTLYLLPEVNLRLRPRLLAELRPGTPVVSHDFDMGDWAPDRTLRVRAPDRPHVLHLWIVPARVEGQWALTLVLPEGTRRASALLAQRFQEVSGTVTTESGERGGAEGRLRGEALTLTLTFASRSLRLEGRVSHDTADGVVGPTAGGDGRWTARRQR